MAASNSSVATNTIIDSSNPLYLHLSDYLGMILVFKFFDGNGFGAWKRAMMIALSAKNKLGFINDTANSAKIYQLQKNLCQITQGSSDIAIYFAKMKSNCDELNAIYFLHALVPLHYINLSYWILMQNEKKKEIHTTTDFTASSASMNASSGGLVNGGTEENRRTLVCTHYKRNGHSINKCYKLIGFPKYFKFNKVKKLITHSKPCSCCYKTKVASFQLDVNDAFLHVDLDVDIYILAPPGMQLPDKQVLKL
ncbi:uncharacterized protein LOC143568791 [Bidens hawaiensis]|uniref:uncharacterized protein LOC143568791 n=1 Tax=Bidens hawaiensis TaxID=980011 RepID=UPI00404B43F4